jgi:sigma-E factor negative regulatory protein RseB
MNISVWRLAVLLAALLQAGLIYGKSPDEAKEWLERMILATRDFNYEGEFVYVRGPHMESMHIIHQGGDEGQRQRMFSLSGSPREIIVSENQVVSLLLNPKKKSDTTGYQRSPFPISLPRDLDNLELSYDFEMLGSDRVAGRKTQVVAIKPRDKWRFGYRLWLDEETGIVLRSVLLDGKAHPLEQLMFTDLQIKPEIDKALLLPSASIPKPQTPSSTAKPIKEKVSESPWQIAGLPLGFKQVMHSRFQSNVDSHATEHMVLTDGLATVSVFLEPLMESKPLLKGSTQLGAMHAFGKIIDNHQALVVGEVPKQTIRKIANSLRHNVVSDSDD